MLTKLIKKWRDYRLRFVPWIAFNLKHRSKAQREEKIVSDEVLLNALLCLLPRLQSRLHNSLSLAKLAEENCKITESELGFCIARAPSKVSNAGTGVLVTAGSVKEGSLVALYPGTLYLPHEPILLPSLGNSFVLRCVDGIHVDGNDRRMSKMIYKSCVSRESTSAYQAADISWLTDTPIMPLNIGQYVNNQSPDFPSNVAYQELDLPLKLVPPNLRRFLPNVWFRSSFLHDHLRLVALVSTANIKSGEEVFSNYYTVIH